MNFQIINDDDGSSGSSSSFVPLGNYGTLTQNEWVGFDIPLGDFSGLGVPNDVDLIFFVSDGTISEILVDNVYFYR